MGKLIFPPKSPYMKKLLALTLIICIISCSESDNPVPTPCGSGSTTSVPCDTHINELARNAKTEHDLRQLDPVRVQVMEVLIIGFVNS